MSTEGEETVSIQADLVPVVGEIFLYQVERKGIVARRDRGVGSKDSRSADFRNRLVKRVAVRHKFTQSLDRYKCRVSLIQMPDSWRNPEGPEHTATANP